MKHKKFYVGTVSKARKNIYYSHKSKTRRYGRIGHLPREWVGKYCLVIPINKGERTQIYGKIRALDLVESILLR